MINESNSITIQKPVNEVFEYINNLDNMPAWQAGIEKLSYTRNPADLGTRFVLERVIMGRSFKISLKIVEFEINRGYTARMMDGPLNMHIRISLEAIEGGTAMTTQMKGEAKGLARLAESVISAQMALSVREDGERLKALLEEM